MRASLVLNWFSVGLLGVGCSASPSMPRSGAGSAGFDPAGGGAASGTSQELGDIDVREHLLASAEGAPSEGLPAGVPISWSWVAGATSTRTTPPSVAYTHANYWGAVFRGAANSTPSNTQLEIRRCTMWFLRPGAAEWSQTGASPLLGGATFSPSYAGGGPDPLVRAAQPGGLDVVPAPGYIFHFWQDNGYQPLDGAVQEIVSNCQARSSLRSATASDDRASADYLIHMGADFRNPADPSCQNDQYICPSWGVGRLERVTTAWRNHTFHSLIRADLDAGVPLPPASIFRLPAG